ncbi:MAG: hypothetical protein JNM17_21560 [Archangium sp.]|nr:hypothetical protein [Archangium sp.]
MSPAEHLRESLADRERWLVYADWLQTRGDPTGELCLLELQDPKSPRIEALRQARRSGATGFDSLDTALDRWSTDGSFDANWFAGHLRAVDLERPWTDDGVDRRDVLRALLTAPCAQFLTQLSLSQEYPDNVGMGTLGKRGEFEWALEMLAGQSLPALTELRVGDRSRKRVELKVDSSNWMITTDPPGTPGARIYRPPRWVGDLQPLFAATPRLERLTVHGEGISFTTLPPTLKQVSLRSRFLRASTLRAIAAYPLPKLEKLTLWPGQWPDSAPEFEPPEPEQFVGRAPVATDLRALLDAKNVPALKHLEVGHTTWTADFLIELANAPLVKQLETLDVRGGVIDVRDAIAVGRLAPAFAHLKSFKK